MAFVVGINFAIAFRLIGLAPRLSIPPLIRFYPLHWVCTVVIFISGLSLLLAYPAKALSNPLFYCKLLALSAALSISFKFQKVLPKHSVENTQLKLLAYLSITLWVLTITAGRFLAYTHSILLASRFY